MRELIITKKCHKQPIMVTIAFKDQTAESRVNQLCQMLEENLNGTDYWYGRIRPREFFDMNLIHLHVFLSIIMSDLITWCNLQRSSSLRIRICWLINDLMHDIIEKDEPILSVVRCLIFILGRIKNARPVCFIIWSALHRM